MAAGNAAAAPAPLNAGAALAHLRDVRAARRAVSDVPSRPGALAVTLTQVLSFRARATRLDRRLPAGSHRQAALGGLQDTVPRAALTALHARVEGVGPASWEDPALVQAWFRGADYVVPAADFAVFTLGALPRDPERAAALEAVGGAVARALDGRPLRTSALLDALPEALASGSLVRAACVTARYRIRWDASTTVVLPAGPPAVDGDAVRLELARRFLGWHGPATAAEFARWAGLSRADAAATWERLAPELVEVALDGRARQLLERDAGALRAAEPPIGVRLLPMRDPLLAVDQALAEGLPPAPAGDDRGGAVTRRLVNSLTGRILVDGRIAGSWGRERERIALFPWPGRSDDRDRIAAEAEGFAGPIGRPMRLRWLVAAGSG